MSGFNGVGVFSFTYNWVNDATNGVPITASRMDTQFADATGGFDLCLTRDGQGSASANLPMNGFNHTGVGNATANNQYVSLGQLSQGTGIPSAGVTKSGTGPAFFVDGPGQPNDHSWQSFFAQFGSGSFGIIIYGNGDVVNQNNSYGAISDEKLKQDIVPATSQWEDIKAIAKITSKYHLKSNPDGPLQLGVVAQDIQKISPGLVSEDNETLSVNYSVLYMKAVKALGEALERIEALEAKVP